MKVLAGLVTQGSGSIGGMTMSKNKQGYYLRARTVPSNPRTSKQLAIRSAFSALTVAWRALTVAQQTAWNLYAKNVPVILNNGQTRVLSGMNWFIGANQLQLQSGGTLVSDAPTIFTLAGAPMVSLFAYSSPGIAVLDVTLLDPPLSPGTGDQIMVQIGRPQSSGVAQFSGPWQFVEAIDSYYQGNLIEVDLTASPAYDATKSQLQWIRTVRILPDGRYSTPVLYGPLNGWDATLSWNKALPWTESIAGTGGGTATIELVQLPSSPIGWMTVEDEGPGLAGVSFSLTGTSPTDHLVTVTVAALTSPGEYDTFLKLDAGGAIGVVYLPLQLTIT